MAKPGKPRPTDNAFLGPLKGGSGESTYAGVLSFMRRRYSRNLKGVDAVVWGIPFDASVSNRPGTRLGPQAIRRASAIFDGDPQYPFGMDPFETLAVVDYGDCAFETGTYTDVPLRIEADAAAILSAGAHLFSLGGDHFVTYPLLKAHAAKHGLMALVQFDAHQDTWPNKGDGISHGSFVARAVREKIVDPARSIQIGVRTQAPETCGIETILGHEIDGLGIDGIVKRIVKRVGKAKAYLTFDIDCLDPAFAPGTGTPVSGGLSSREALGILRKLSKVNFVGGDVVEVSPPYDHADITAIAGATVAMYYLGLLAEKRRG